MPRTSLGKQCWRQQLPLGVTVWFGIAQLRYFWGQVILCWCFPGGLVVKNPYANAGDLRDEGSIPELGRSPREGNGNPLQYSCLEKSHGLRSLAGYSPLGLQKRVRHDLATKQQKFFDERSCPMHCRVSSSITGLYLPDANSARTDPGIAWSPLRSRTIQIENHRCMGETGTKYTWSQRV